MVSRGQRQGEQLYRANFRHHQFLPTDDSSSVVADSQSPEPSAYFPTPTFHPRAPIYDDGPPAHPRPPASRSLVPDSLAASPSRHTRSRSPSAVDLDERRAFKQELLDDHMPDDVMADDERRAVYRSRVNDERRRPGRRRERAPSYERAVKAELDVAGMGAARRGHVEGEEEGPMLPPGGARLPTVLRNKRPAPARSSSPSSTSGASDDSDDGITTPRSGTSSLFRPEEDDEHGDDSDGTPSGPRPSARRAVERGGVVKSKKKRKEKKRTKADRERDTLNFLDSLDPPQGPVFRPLGVKQRLINRAAESTAALPPQARVERVEIEPRSPSPPQEDHEGVLVGAGDVGPGAAWPPGGERSGPSPAGSPAGSLPDYDEEEDGPEVPLVSIEDPVLLEEQGYFRRPTEEGAIRRWVVMLEREKRPLPPLYDHALLSSDLAYLRTLPLRLPPALSPSPPAPSLALPCALPLLRTRPSPETCAALWADLRSPTHAAQHARADCDAEPPSGRGCRCPVWVPPSPGGTREWAVERARAGREEGASVEGLVEVARRVFDLDAERDLSAHEMDLVGLVYEHNWLWYTQLLDLSRIATHSRHLASPQLIADLASHLTYTRGQHAVERGLAHRRLEEDRARAREEGRIADRALMQETELAEHKARDEEHRLADLLSRLEVTLDEQVGGRAAAVRDGQEGDRAGATQEWVERRGWTGRE
ncbi:uncharacterized protein RHOBADRAFT_50630 [Rhodotorula graminis WP1]|uniref:Uncharacterized protein n=1 Tax=Rhodotorula graminis (strain WP1) TaxID=578459 RepID=A0A194SF10_RHOGW|nr:uncharacterized protein RHOBADRAFT_50630 [Rhodotorula graminis WP1]KPV78121.1 hypothetical protein RHOBADRAFT_50630 [Rhodotorula graminis WP1]